MFSHHLLLLGRHLLEPLLAVLLDLLVEQLVLLLAALADVVLHHLAVLERLDGRLLQPVRAHPGPAAHDRVEQTLAEPLRPLFTHLLLELPTRNGLSRCELGRDVLPFEAFQHRPRVCQTHRSQVFQEGDEGHELLVLGIAVPSRKDDGIFRL